MRTLRLVEKAATGSTEVAVEALRKLTAIFQACTQGKVLAIKLDRLKASGER